MSDDPTKPPRFPYVAALLCAACVGAAAWTWMRYSYCWSFPDTYLPMGGLWMPTHDPKEQLLMEDRFICLEGPWRLAHAQRVVFTLSRRRAGLGNAVSDGNGPKPIRSIQVLLDDAAQPIGRPLPVRGRVLYNFTYRHDVHPEYLRVIFDGPIIDTTASRFTGASIAGLVVGAMGVFVFAVALRHWLNQRGAFHVQTAESDT